MNKEDICFMPAHDMAEKIKTQDMSAVEITETIIERIQKINPLINAYCTPTFKIARENAKKADKRVKSGEEVGALNGIPTSIKDLMDTKGIRTTYGSKLHENHVPDENSLDVQLLIDAGCVIMGKTNTPENGYAGMTSNLVFGTTNNPWNLERTSGGSSGGAGAAVAAGISPLALGSDGGGSIRHPACLCGIFGIKPSYGRVPIYPRNGLAGYFYSHHGPMTRYVKDAALMLDVLKEYDELDKECLPHDEASYFEQVDNAPRKLKIAFTLDLGNLKVIDPEVERAVLDSVDKFKEEGWEVIHHEKINLRPPQYAFNTMYTACFAHDLEKAYKKHRDLISPDLVKLIEAGLSYKGINVLKAFHKRNQFYVKTVKFMRDYDLLITPTTATFAFEHGIMFPSQINGVGVPPTGWQPYTWPFNLTGMPAATLPCGWSREGTPIGMQIVGHMHDDLKVLQACRVFERLQPWQGKRPSFE